MTNFRNLFLGATIACVPLTTHANTDLYVELSRCAQTALDGQQMGAKKISVKAPTDDIRKMDHDLSRFVTEYRMSLTNQISGEKLGKVTCRISDGRVTSSTFVDA